MTKKEILTYETNGFTVELETIEGAPYYVKVTKVTHTPVDPRDRSYPQGYLRLPGRIEFDDGTYQSVIAITAGACAGVQGLTVVSLPNALQVIGRRAFAGCRNLTTCLLGDGAQLNVIESEAFDGCTNLVAGCIPSSVTYLGENIFNGCENLIKLAYNAPNARMLSCMGSSICGDCRPEKLEIGKKVIVIPDRLCGSFSNMPDIYIPHRVECIAPGAFDTALNIIYHGNAEGAPWGAKWLNGKEIDQSH